MVTWQVIVADAFIFMGLLGLSPSVTVLAVQRQAGRFSGAGWACCPGCREPLLAQRPFVEQVCCPANARLEQATLAWLTSQLLAHQLLRTLPAFSIAFH